MDVPGAYYYYPASVPFIQRLHSIDSEWRADA